MNRKGKKYDLDFKIRVIRSVETGQMSLTEAIRHYQVSGPTISRWQEMAANGDLISRAPTDREVQLEKELNEYKKRIAELYMEIEFLKKAEAFEQKKNDLSSVVVTGENWEQYRKLVES